MSWTDERVEVLKTMWGEGKSASQIAKELGGVTRNAVIGKVHRLSLPGRAKSGGTSTSRSKRAAPSARSSSSTTYASRTTTTTTTRSMPRSSGATALKQEIVTDAVAYVDTRPVDDVVIPISRKLPLTELTEKTCKWPVGDPMQEDFFFCGTDCDEAAPYCSYHSKLAFQPASERRRAR